MSFFDAVIILLPLAAGGWASWWVPRWAGQHPRSPARPDEWTADGLPSRPYRDLHRLP